MTRFFAFLTIGFLMVSCAGQKQVANPQQPISAQFNKPGLNYHTGFMLKELSDGKVVFEQNADKNFVAASNIKLLNFYTGLNMLGDSVPSFQYVIKKDSLLIWPMADPTFLNPDFGKQPAFDFIKNSNKQVFIINGRYKGEKYGAGWAWDDYNESIQPEITAFPIYGNVMLCMQDSVAGFKTKPDLSSLYFSESAVSRNSSAIKRNISNNNIIRPANLKAGYKQKLPIAFNSNILESLLTDTLLATGMVTTSVNTLPWRPLPANARTVYNAGTREVYKKMMQNGDNFIAEEMMLNYAAANKMEMDCKAVIQKSATGALAGINGYKWADGSGLSRLNLISPQSMISVLEKIKQKVNEETLFATLAAGGKSGTLKTMFAGSQPFVFAKSGSMPNVYNLSGYLVGKSGKRYAFSYLNNNFLGGTKEVQAEVERFLTFVHNNY